MHQAHLRFVVIILLSVFCIFLSLSLFFTYNYDGLFENLSIYFHYFQKISALSYIFYIALLFESVIRFNIVFFLITALISILLSISTLNYNENHTLLCNLGTTIDYILVVLTGLFFVLIAIHLFPLLSSVNTFIIPGGFTFSMSSALVITLFILTTILTILEIDFLNDNSLLEYDLIFFVIIINFIEASCLIFTGCMFFSSNILVVESPVVQTIFENILGSLFSVLFSYVSQDYIKTVNNIKSGSLKRGSEDPLNVEVISRRPNQEHHQFDTPSL